MKLLESHHQKQFVSWCNMKGLFYFAPINENPYSKHIKDKKIIFKIEADLKALGKRKGINDFFVYLPNKLLHIEFKLPTNKQSKEQVLCEKHINGFDYAEYYLVFSYDEAVRVVEENL